MPAPSHRGRSFLRTGILFEAGLIVLALGLGWLVRTPAFAALELDWRPLLLGVVATIPPVLALGWCLSTTHPRLVRLVDMVDTTVGPLIAGAPVGSLLVLSLVAGVGEEALFRGVLQPGLTKLVGPLAALLLVSLLFGLVHFVTATYAVLAGLIGLYLGWLLLATGNLLVPIVVHALYDFVALSLVRNRDPVNY